MDIENRTPHAIALRNPDGSSRIFEPVRPSIRLELRPGPVVATTDSGVPILDRVSVHGISGLPKRKPGTVFVVSQLAALGISYLHPDRDDIVHPNGLDRASRADSKGTLSVASLIRA